MRKKMLFYRGGYYLIKLRPIGFGTQISKSVFTCSDCINDSLIGSWSYSWTTNNDLAIEEIEDQFQLKTEQIQSIREWVDRAYEDKRIGWSNLFCDLETAQEYSRTFFEHLPERQIISVYFSEAEVADLLSEFKLSDEGRGAIGLYDSLLKKVPESLLARETFLGFDLVGIECSGDFHTFYCHDISKDLVERFKLTINQYGLFEDIVDWKPVVDYLNAEENGFEPVPWFVCKVKLVN